MCSLACSSRSWRMQTWRRRAPSSHPTSTGAFGILTVVVPPASCSPALRPGGPGGRAWRPGSAHPRPGARRHRPGQPPWVVARVRGAHVDRAAGGRRRGGLLGAPVRGDLRGTASCRERARGMAGGVERRGESALTAIVVRLSRRGELSSGGRRQANEGGAKSLWGRMWGDKKGGDDGDKAYLVSTCFQHTTALAVSHIGCQSTRAVPWSGALTLRPCLCACRSPTTPRRRRRTRARLGEGPGARAGRVRGARITRGLRRRSQRHRTVRGVHARPCRECLRASGARGAAHHPPSPRVRRTWRLSTRGSMCLVRGQQVRGCSWPPPEQGWETDGTGHQLISFAWIMAAGTQSQGSKQAKGAFQWG